MTVNQPNQETGPQIKPEAGSTPVPQPAMAGAVPTRQTRLPDMPENGTDDEPPVPAASAGPDQDLLQLVMNRRTLLILVSVLGVALFIIMRPFLVPFILALCFTTLFFPLYRRLVTVFCGSRAWGSLACCLILLVGLLVPSYILVHLIALQMIDLYNSAQPVIREITEKGSAGVLGSLYEYRFMKLFSTSLIDWRNVVQEMAKGAGRLGTTLLNRTSSSVFSVLGTLVSMLFSMFYLFKDGDKLLRRVRFLSPLKNKYEEMLMARFLLISRASIKGTLLVGLAQGVLGGLTFLVFGIESWLLWGFVMIMLSLVPFTGAWMVMVPASIIQLMLGHHWRAAGIFLMCVVVVSSIDNLLRPRLVGTQAKMHDLLIFFSTLGGIAAFGIMGFIIGPVIAALFVTIIDIYGMEFNEQLYAAQYGEGGKPE